MPVCEAM
ncbi:hypothetical protein F383_16652 [Gossypium arboreum]|nr:hypothetical protein F383_16652 [Gossypium arboreum]